MLRDRPSGSALVHVEVQDVVCLGVTGAHERDATVTQMLEERGGDIPAEREDHGVERDARCAPHEFVLAGALCRHEQDAGGVLSEVLSQAVEDADGEGVAEGVHQTSLGEDAEDARASLSQ